MTLPAGEAPARPSTAARPTFPHNALVLRGFDPTPGDPDRAADADAVGVRLGSYLIRLEAVDSDLADAFAMHVGVTGGRFELVDAEAGVAVVAIGRDPLEALRNRLLAAPQALLRIAEEIAAALRAYHRAAFTVPCCGRAVECGARPLLMGTINCTPDSFYEGSRTGGAEAIERGRRMLDEGADLLDVGGESTRPGSAPVAAEEEIARVVPVIERLAAASDVPISIDTTKAAVARAALDAGAVIVNDISGLRFDPELGELVAERGAGLVLMHMRGTPDEMYAEARYEDVLADVGRELRDAVARATAAGVHPEALILDPGIGFAKRAEHSLAILRGLASMRSLGRPLLVGPSRKSFIGAVLDLPPEDRLEGTAAAVSAAVLAGAHIVRVHDVEAMRRVAAMAAAIRAEGSGWVC